MSNVLPKGWTSAPLYELLSNLESGSRPRGGVRGIAEGVPSIGGEHLNYNGGFNLDSIKFVPRNFADTMSKGQIRRNDVLIVKDGATTGKTAFVDASFPFDEAVVNEHVFICRPVSGVEPRFLFWYLISKEGQERILENFQGSAQGGINQSFASNTEVPLAPNAEQRRIVVKLEGLLPQIEGSKRGLEKIPSLLKRFRQSVLAAACSGRLTADWREERKNTDWTSVIVGKKFKSFGGGTPNRGTAVYWRGEIPWLSSGDIKAFRIDTATEFITKAGLENSSAHICRPGSVIVVMRSGILKHTLPVAILNNEAAINQDIKCFDSGDDDLNHWLALNLKAAERSLLAQNREGTTVQSVKYETIRDFEIQVPSKPEMDEAVRRANNLLAMADKIESRYKKAQAQVNKLTQSILAKAFRGELVPQDPNDEPASKLLEKIKKDK